MDQRHRRRQPRRGDPADGRGLAGVESSFVLDHRLNNSEAVVLAPVTDGRWSCVQWGTQTPPFYPEPDATPVTDGVESGADPMG